VDIRPVPAPERNLRGIDFFLLWAGVAISLGGPDRLRHPAVGAVDRFFIGAMAVLTLPVGGSLPSMFTAGIIYWVFARAGKTAS
jgi:hypothetical protein